MATALSPRVGAFLQACSQEYDLLREVAIRRLDHMSPETRLTLVETIAGFAGMQHPGRFFDGAVENIALDVGQRLPTGASIGFSPQVLIAPRFERGARRVLHVATTIHGIGGHTRTIVRWMQKDPTSVHSLVLTAQGEVPIPRTVHESVHLAKGQLISLPEQAPISARAACLRKIAAESADLVILHLVPNDPVPVAAFAVDGPPVGLVNLADQCYWLGATVADSVIHLREIGATSSRTLRSTRGDKLLPIPLNEARTDLDRREARRLLGVPDAQTLLLTIGRSMKYTPSERHNFFRTAASILDQHADAHLYLVGVRAEDHRQSPGFLEHGRMHFLGPIEDPSIWQRAADVYLEGFPFGSQTALLESILPAVPCVPAHSPATPLLATQDFALDDVVTTPKDEAEYIQRAGQLIDDRGLRDAVGAELRARVLRYHVDPTWNEFLEPVYDALLGVRHRAERIPRADGATREVDLAIAEYHGTRHRSDDVPARIRQTLHSDIRDNAFWLRHRRDFAGALQLLMLSASLKKVDRRTLIEAVKVCGDWALAGLGRRRN